MSAYRSEPAAWPALPQQRNAAIDALRGLTFVVMVWVNELAGVSDISHWWKHMPAHADAMSFPDIVFPAFLFIVGLSIPFALQRRLQAGDGPLPLARHIGERTLALVLMGLFMVNAESGHHAESMALPIAGWSLLFFAAVVLVWGDWRGGSTLLRAALRAAGWALLLALALLYRGGPEGRDGLAPQWWGILGLIGWAYALACVLYLAARGRLGVLIALTAACTAFVVLDRLGPGGPVARALLGQSAHAAHASIVLCGVVCALILHDERRAAPPQRRLLDALAWALLLLIAGLALRPAFGISKIHATPSWCLLCAAICVLLYLALHALVQAGRGGWMRLVEPAASNPLVTYLLPYVILAAMTLLGLSWPAAWRTGLGGMLAMAVYAALIVAAAGAIGRAGLRIRL
ncbi:DUF5009 domain-containing protein [Aquincola sp. S2]|uniref:DUF5009 domain-containing protein n=1 Tax=Pseudaquabacterium terrae TaxID=2732868 RepID=A0ABX2ESF9_9BURK|nr:DUF5009 domain-containing protein [Aquabacterium terrae]